ncbi:hypothetical protein [Bacillus sp. FJAT-27251]|uniref:hypothetical protein n=1 Tax=Bacillus sp. FJAT-27251 TaxID=1684142 RepID=UPI000AB2C218|nr:hypothetical protein [Bacillus sp. FJAT-27251]
MEKNKSEIIFSQEQFFDLMKRFYEKGIQEEEITVQKWLDEFKLDIQNATGK